MRSFVMSFIFLVAGPSAALAEPSLAADALAGKSENFDVRSFRSGPSAADVLNKCDALRAQCRRLWLASEKETTWRPRCTVVLHASRASYLQAVGRGGAQTSGSSLVRFDGDRVATRKVDVLVDGKGEVSALAHELTHVVLADRFGTRRPPRWLDEGIATLADTAAKQSLHERDCRRAIDGGSALRLVDLLPLEEFTSAAQVPAFYGQSLSLVRFLAERGEPAKIVDFAEAAMVEGYDRALKEYYGIDDVAALESRWREYAASRQEAPADQRIVPVSHRP